MAMNRSSPFWSLTGATTTTPVVVALPSDWSELKVVVDALSYAATGNAYAAPAVAGVNAITTIESRGTPTAGTFTITALPNDAVAETTSALTFDESAADVKTALVALNAFATGDITAAGGALPTAITLTWTGVWAKAAPPLLITSSVTPGIILPRVTTAPAGNGGYGYVDASVPEVWSRDDSRSGNSRFFYVATVASTGNFFISAYR